MLSFTLRRQAGGLDRLYHIDLRHRRAVGQPAYNDVHLSKRPIFAGNRFVGRHVGVGLLAPQVQLSLFSVRQRRYLCSCNGDRRFRAPL